MAIQCYIWLLVKMTLIYWNYWWTMDLFQKIWLLLKIRFVLCWFVHSDIVCVWMCECVCCYVACMQYVFWCEHTWIGCVCVCVCVSVWAEGKYTKVKFFLLVCHAFFLYWNFVSWKYNVWLKIFISLCEKRRKSALFDIQMRSMSRSWNCVILKPTMCLWFCYAFMHVFVFSFLSVI